MLGWGVGVGLVLPRGRETQRTGKQMPEVQKEADEVTPSVGKEEACSPHCLDAEEGPGQTLRDLSECSSPLGLWKGRRQEDAEKASAEFPRELESMECDSLGTQEKCC